MKLIYPAIFTPDSEVGGYTVVFPDLPGCITEGDTLNDSITMAQDAAGGWLVPEVEKGEKLPEATPINDVLTSDPSDFVSLVQIDMNYYLSKYGKEKVRKNLTIPAWLNSFAEERHINFSKVLTDALAEMYAKF